MKLKANYLLIYLVPDLEGILVVQGGTFTNTSTIAWQAWQVQAQSVIRQPWIATCLADT